MVTDQEHNSKVNQGCIVNQISLTFIPNGPIGIKSSSRQAKLNCLRNAL